MTYGFHRLAYPLLALTTALLTPACEDAASVGEGEGWEFDAAASPAAGHWFYCETDDCSVLDKDGLGLLDDGSFAWLDATEGSAFCMEAEDRDLTWTWVDGELQIGDESGRRLVDFVVDGDRALFKPAGEEGEPQPMKRVDPAGLTGDCPAAAVAATQCPLDAEGWSSLRLLVEGWTGRVNPILALSQTAYFPFPQLFATTWSSFGQDAGWTCSDSLGGHCGDAVGALQGTQQCYDWTCGQGQTIVIETAAAAAGANPDVAHPFAYTIAEVGEVRFARNPTVAWTLENHDDADRRVDASIDMQVELEAPSGAIYDFSHSGGIALEEDRAANLPRSLAIDLSFPDLLQGQTVELSVALDAQKKATGTITAGGATIATFASGEVWQMREVAWSGDCGS